MVFHVIPKLNIPGGGIAVARVLVIEDEPNIALVMKIALSDEGHEVTTVLNGMAGLEQLERAPAPEIVFSDLYMPGISGRAVIETMHANPELKDIPVVIITGSIPGLNDFPPRESYSALLSKPFDLEEIIKMVDVLTKAGKQFGTLSSPKLAG